MHNTPFPAMAEPAVVRRRVRSILVITLVMTGGAVLYALLFSGAHPHALITAAISGVIIGLGIGLAEVLYFQERGTRLRFSVLLAVRTVFYVVFVTGTLVLVIMGHNAGMRGISLGEMLAHPEARAFLAGREFLMIVLYALLLTTAVNFIRQVNRLLGHNVLLAFVTGRYHRPMAEDRVFMFLDITASTGLAEHLGDLRYHEFLNEFFYDVSPAILETGGRVYQYVGDEVVITWPAAQGVRDMNCIRCFFRIAAILARNGDEYERRFGLVPRFKAGLHAGRVIAGEIGDLKKEIVFHGDVVNTAARIRSECARHGRILLLSKDLLDRLDLGGSLSPENVGTIRLPGKHTDVTLYSFAEAA